jgi:hypothetical protein
MVKYLSFHNSAFCFKILFNVNGKATVCNTPLVAEVLKTLGAKFASSVFPLGFPCSLPSTHRPTQTEVFFLPSYFRVLFLSFVW